MFARLIAVLQTFAKVNAVCRVADPRSNIAIIIYAIHVIANMIELRESQFLPMLVNGSSTFRRNGSPAA
jgi:hypothetical protein|tara:strand:+ start:321 stop:527 length:207 start_codon:yes stop_codon:yes gene_type:complete